MAKYTTVGPAYGRDYKSAKAAREDFLNGKDFILHDIMSQWDGKPCSIRDLKKDGYTSVTIRYKRMSSLTVVKL